MRNALIGSVMVLCAIGLALAKRVPPRPVTPLVQNGVEYSADDDGRNQYVVATDIATNKELWRVKVFHTRIKFWVEEDVQWVFITNLFPVGNDVGVRDEKARCYRVDVKKRRAKHMACP